MRQRHTFSTQVKTSNLLPLLVSWHFARRRPTEGTGKTRRKRFENLTGMHPAQAPGSGPDKAIPTFLCYGGGPDDEDDEDYEDYEDDKDERDAANDNSQHALCR